MVYTHNFYYGPKIVTQDLQKRIYSKNHTHVEKVGHTSKFLNNY